MKLKPLSAALVSAAFACLSGPLLAQTPQSSNNAPTNPRAMERGRMGWQQERQQKLEDVSRLLDLTPDQQTKARQIFENSWAQRRQLIPQMEQNRMDARSLFKNSSPAAFDAEMDRWAARQGRLYADMMKIHAETMKQFYTILTPAQKEKAAALYDLLTSRMMFGLGEGPGHPGMRRGPTE